MFVSETPRAHKLRIGVLGCGPIAQFAHLEACRKAHNASLYAICDMAEDLAARMAAIHAPERVYHDYDAMLEDPNVTAKAIGKVMSQDTGLTARLLKIVNSSFYGFTSKIETVSRAVTVIGLRELRGLVLAASAIETFSKIPTEIFNMVRFWRHSVYCGVVAQLLAERCNVLHSERLFVAGLLHDIGKLVVPTRLLQKTGALTTQEYEIVMQHTIRGAEIVAPLCAQLPVVVDVVRWHHERVDGMGRSEMVNGQDIPLAARMVAVVDAFDAMTSHRPYRGPTSLDTALCELESNTGTQFDAACVRALRSSFDSLPRTLPVAHAREQVARSLKGGF